MAIQNEYIDPHTQNTDIKLDEGGTNEVSASELVKALYNIVLLAFYRAIDNSKTIFNLLDGFIDEYEDESGIDTVSSTNESYNSTDDYYEPDNSGTITESQTTSDQWYALGRYDNGNTYYRFGQSFKVDSTQVITRVDIELGAVTGSPTGNLCFRIETDNSGSPSGTLVHANATKTITPTASQWNEATFDNSFTLTGDTTYWIVFSCDTQSTSNYWQFKNTGTSSYSDGVGVWDVNGGGWSAWGGDCTFKVYKELTANMTLISEPQSAESEPDSARIIIFEEDVDSITLNTDLKAYISRDDGSTWGEGTLSNEGNYDSSKKVLVANVDLSLSGIGSGTDMVYKLVTDNNKDLKVHGTALLWD